MLRRLADCAQPPAAPTPVIPAEALDKLRDVFARYPTGHVPPECDREDNHEIRPVPAGEIAPAGGEEFWDARPTLAHIRTYGRAQMCSPGPSWTSSWPAS